jgi:putative ABC transport system permease protein
MLLRDLTYAWRTMRRSPAFAVTAVVTIGLGIGACAAIFSVANAVLIRPLPYHNPDRLILACGDLRARSVKDWPFSNADFFDLRNGARTMFEDFAAVTTGRMLWSTEDGTPEQIRTASVTANFFRLLGANIAFGRNFSDPDGHAHPTMETGAAANTQAQRLPDVVILSHEYWQRRYRGSASVLGRITNSGAQIVGVLAPGFELLLPPGMNMERSPDVWFAARLNYDAASRNNVAHQVIGRLQESATLESARAEAESVAASLRKVDSIHNTAGFQIRIEPMQKYLSAEIRPALLALTGAAIFLLLIACANVANLLLVRTSRRERELAVRTALGAGSRHLVRQLLVEALLLSGLGTVLGVGMAWLGIRELLIIAPANMPRLESIGIDTVVLGFAALVGLATAAIFGLVPMLRASRTGVIDVLRASGRSAGLAGGKLFRNSVVIVEVALSFVLLIGSGLMIRSFLALQRIDPGYEPRGILTFQILGTPVGSTPEQRAAFMREIQARLAGLPGVDGVTAANPFPLAGGFSPIRWGTEQALTDPSKFQAAEPQAVLPGYFEALRTKVIAGRTFTEADNAPGRNGVIIDQLLAAKAFRDGRILGRRILIRARSPEPEWVEVIGVVAHQRTTSLAEAGREQIYFTDGFFGHGAATHWAIRSARAPAQLAGAVRDEIARYSSQLLVSEVQTLEALVERAKARTRFSLLLIGVLATIAALLAGVGLYGVMSTLVQQRTAEIGIRMAVGAEPARIFRLVIGQGLLLSGAGIVAGLLAAFGLTHLMTSMLVGVKATDPSTFGAMAVLFFLIAALASWLPARRAASLDPTAALREG